MRLGFIPGGDFLTPKALEVIKRAERKLTFIPMVFILLRIWGTIRFFRFLCYHPEDPPAIEILVFLHVSRIIIYTVKVGFMARIGDRWNRDKIVSHAAVFVSSRKCVQCLSVFSRPHRSCWVERCVTSSLRASSPF